MKPALGLSLALLLLPLPTVGQAADAAQALVLKFEGAYRKSKTLRASFLERYLDNGKEVRSEAGLAYFAKPGKMRWEYRSPEANLFVIDGKWSWFYVPSDHTVTRIRAKQSSDWRTPLALLAGEMKVSRFCRRVEIDPAWPRGGHDAVLKCLLRDEGRGAAKSGAGAAAANPVLLELNRDTGELSRILVTDPGGIGVEFRFANWEFDPPVGADTFRFLPPEGVAIVDGDLDPTAERGRPGSAP
jgi:outer membrane lipoprotein carrier protein